MPERFHTIALPIDDDVMIVLPDEFGIEPGVSFEVSRRGDSIILRPGVETNEK